MFVKRYNLNDIQNKILKSIFSCFSSFSIRTKDGSICIRCACLLPNCQHRETLTHPRARISINLAFQSDLHGHFILSFQFFFKLNNVYLWYFTWHFIHTSFPQYVYSLMSESYVVLRAGVSSPFDMTGCSIVVL